MNKFTLIFWLSKWSQDGTTNTPAIKQQILASSRKHAENLGEAIASIMGEEFLGRYEHYWCEVVEGEQYD